jgi:hypothetical protein
MGEGGRFDSRWSSKRVGQIQPVEQQKNKLTTFRCSHNTTESAQKKREDYQATEDAQKERKDYQATEEAQKERKDYQATEEAQKERKVHTCRKNTGTTCTSKYKKFNNESDTNIILIISGFTYKVFYNLYENGSHVSAHWYCTTPR